MGRSRSPVIEHDNGEGQQKTAYSCHSLANEKYNEQYQKQSF